MLTVFFGVFVSLTFVSLLSAAQLNMPSLVMLGSSGLEYLD